MNVYWKHFKVITRHKFEVFKACYIAGIAWQGLKHDVSKYSLIEFASSAQNFQGKRSPIDAEKEAKGYSVAWQHHKGHNPHHYEYWIDNLDAGGEALVIPYKYALEMICDWIGAGKVYGGDKWTIKEPMEFWNKKKQTAKIHEKIQRFIDRVLIQYAEYGNYALNSEFTRRVYEEEANALTKDYEEVSD